MNLGIASRVALLMSLVFLIAMSAVTIFFSRQTGAQLEALMGARLESIAATAAPDISGDGHDQIRTKDDHIGEEYSAIQRVLARIAQVNGVKPHLVYTLRPQREGFELVVMADPARNDIGDKYLRVPPELGVVIATGRSMKRGRYETENGTWISGFAPVKNAEGRTVAILEVDYEISEFLARLQKEIVKTLSIAVSVFLIGVLTIFLVVRATTRRIVELTALADAISRGEVEKQVPAMGTDEVGRLAAALERLRESVRTSIELLKG